MEKKRSEQAVRRLMRQTGMTANYTGYGYLTEAVSLALEEPWRMQAVTKEIYRELAERHGSTAGNIERDMRTAIQAVWGREPELLRESTGYLLQKRPTVSQLVGSIVEKIFVEETEL